MATVNKNFKVKNGLEVGTTTVVASIDSSGNANIAGNLTANTGFVSADTFRLDTTYSTGSVQAGEFSWNNDDGTADLRLKDGDVVLQLGQEQVARVKNASGATLQEGKVVAISGAAGQRITAVLANAAAESTSTKTFGIVTHSGGIANETEGYVTVFGLVRNINTTAYSTGQALWLSNVAGELTATKPVAPDNGVFVGWVVSNVSASAGSIFVNVQNGYEVDELHDVKYTSLATNDILQRTANNLWENKTLAAANIANLAATGLQTFSGPITITGNANATTFNGSGAGLTSIPNSATTANSANGASTIVARDASGNFTANVITATNINTTTITATGAVSGFELTSTQSSGSEGGQINLAKPQTTNLSSNVTVDIYNNQIRFFDSGGTNRGAYIDLTASANGVGTNLLSGVSSNFIINGAFDIWQRGTTFSADGYCADRWYFDETGTCVVTQETVDVPTGYVYALRANATTSSDSADIYYSLEQLDVEQLRGKTVTFSVNLKMDANMISQTGDFELKTYYSNVSDARTSQTTVVNNTANATSTVITKSNHSGWAVASHTFVVPTDAVGLRLAIEPPLTGVSPSQAVYLVTGAQLELGSVATPFRRSSPTYAQELAACQRYYVQFTAGSVGGNFAFFATTTAYSTTAAAWAAMLPDTMRTIPSISTSGNFRLVGSTTVNVTSIALYGVGSMPQPVSVTVSVASGLTSGSGYILSANNDPTATVKFDSEL